MDRLAALPSESLVYCAHEYTASNYKFLASIDPDTCLTRYEEIQKTRSLDQPTVPSSIEAELRSNLFMQCHSPRLQALVGAGSAEEAMANLRNMKNSF